MQDFYKQKKTYNHAPVAEARDDGFSMDQFMKGGQNQKTSATTGGPYQEDDGFNYKEFMKGTGGRRESM